MPSKSLCENQRVGLCTRFMGCCASRAYSSEQQGTNLCSNVVIQILPPLTVSSHSLCTPVHPSGPRLRTAVHKHIQDVSQRVSWCGSSCCDTDAVTAPSLAA